MLPAVNDRIGIDFLHSLQNSHLQFLQGGNPDVPEKGPAHLGKEGFDQVEPRAMLGCMDINEAVGARGKIRPSFLGDMGRMVV